MSTRSSKTGQLTLEVKSDEGNVWRLIGELDLGSLMAWRELLDEVLPVSESVNLDFSELEIAGSAILALLVHLVRRSGPAGGSVQVTNPPEKLAEMAEMTDLTGLPGFPALK